MISFRIKTKVSPATEGSALGI